MHKGTPHEVATQTAIYTRRGCERCIRYAFELTRKRNNPKGKKLTLVAKTNVLTIGHDLWWRTFQEVAKEYPDVEDRLQPRRRLLHVDREEPRVLRRDRHHEHVRRHHHRPLRHHPRRHGRRRRRQHQPRPGGISMFEPMGGSAPKYTGTGKINPIAAINAVSMMLDQLGEPKAGQARDERHP